MTTHRSCKRPGRRWHLCTRSTHIRSRSQRLQHWSCLANFQFVVFSLSSYCSCNIFFRTGHGHRKLSKVFSIKHAPFRIRTSNSRLRYGCLGRHRSTWKTTTFSHSRIHTYFLGYSGNCLCSTYLTFENHIIVPSRPKANFFFRYLAIFYKRIRQQESEHKPPCLKTLYKLSSGWWTAVFDAMPSTLGVGI